MQLYYYCIHGLNIESEIQFYELDSLVLSSCHKPDVKIQISYHFIDKIQQQTNYTTFFSENKIWFKTEISAFQIENGNQIFVAPYKNANINMLSSYILGWCMSFVFYQKNILGFHCSALVYKEKAFLISGFSGAGKSTTSLSLIRKGCQYLSDDIAFVFPNNRYTVFPSLPIQKYCRNIANTIEDKTNLIYINEERDKYALIDKIHFDSIPRPLSAFILLETSNTKNIEYKHITGLEAIPILLNSLFMAPVLRKASFPLKYKTECLKLAGSIKVIKIIRPKNLDTIDEISTLIAEDLEDICQP